MMILANSDYRLDVFLFFFFVLVVMSMWLLSNLISGINAEMETIKKIIEQSAKFEWTEVRFYPKGDAVKNQGEDK